jgi:predicted dehydrogenase
MHYKKKMSNKKKINVCLIGPGRIGMTLELDKLRKKPATHFGMWLKNKDANLIAVCDVDNKKNKIAKKLKSNILFYTDYKKMLREIQPQIISISTWKNSHYKITSDCLNLGVKVIVLEKPLANNIHQSKLLINLIKKKKAKVLINHRRRYDDEIIKLAKLLKEGIIGEILQVSSHYVYGLLTTGTHLIDTLRMLLVPVVGEITHVTGFNNNFKSHVPLDDKNYDGFLIFKNGLKASFQSHNIKNYDIFDFHIYGSKGKILITSIGRRIFNYKIIKSPEHTGFTELDYNIKEMCKSSPRPQFQRLSDNAINCLNSKKTQPLCSAYDSYIDMLVINGIIKSAKLKRPIKIKLQS